MPDIIPITKVAFADKRWRRSDNCSFAANDAVCPLTQQELFKAVLSLPIGFIVKEDVAFPVAILGLKPGQNLLVDAQGKWLGRYIPAAYRGYPFTLGQTKDGQQLLCFDAESGLMDTGEGGEAFYTEEGEPTDDIKGILDFMSNVAENRKLTQHICTALQEKNLIQPWPIKINIDGNETVVEGIYRIDETALNDLDKDDFEDIRKVGALPLIYSQLLSMQHLQSLVTLASKQSQPKVEEINIDKIFGEDSGDQLFKF